MAEDVMIVIDSEDDGAGQADDPFGDSMGKKIL